MQYSPLPSNPSHSALFEILFEELRQRRRSVDPHSVASTHCQPLERAHSRFHRTGSSWMVGGEWCSQSITCGQGAFSFSSVARRVSGEGIRLTQLVSTKTNRGGNRQDRFEVMDGIRKYARLIFDVSATTRAEWRKTARKEGFYTHHGTGG